MTLRRGVPLGEMQSWDLLLSLSTSFKPWTPFSERTGSCFIFFPNTWAWPLCSQVALDLGAVQKEPGVQSLSVLLFSSELLSRGTAGPEGPGIGEPPALLAARGQWSLLVAPQSTGCQESTAWLVDRFFKTIWGTFWCVCDCRSGSLAQNAEIMDNELFSTNA